MSRYKFQETNTLGLDIPEEAATNKAEVAAYKVGSCKAHVKGCL